MGYKTNVFKGVSWVGVLRASTRGITFIRLAILARILTPSQFGAFGIATLVLSFLEILTETGINVFLVQEKKVNEYINSAWIVSIIRGTLISILLLVLAPLISEFFNSNESTHLLYLIAFVPFIRGFINPSVVYIQKNIEFHKEFYFRLILFLIDSLVAIIAAFVTRSALSFVYGLIVSAIIEVIISYIFFRPLPMLTFDFPRIKHVIVRGWWVTITGISSFLSDNSDNGAVGKLMGANSLGIYQVAYKLSTIPISEITDTVNKVIFPVYSRFSDDKVRLFRAFIKVTSVTAILASFIGLFIFIYAEQIVFVVVGENWASAVPVIKILSIYGVLRTVFGNFAPMALSLKMQKQVAFATSVRCIGLLIIIIPLVSSFGLTGAGFAMLISIIIEIPIIIYFIWRIFVIKK